MFLCPNYLCENFDKGITRELLADKMRLRRKKYENKANIDKPEIKKDDFSDDSDYGWHFINPNENNDMYFPFGHDEGDNK